MKRLILSALITGAVLLGAAALLDARDAPSAAETMASAPREAESREESFVLAEYGGRVAVYPAGERSSPREITSIWVYHLPSADRTELKSGIAADSRAALAALLEDLGS